MTKKLFEQLIKIEPKNVQDKYIHIGNNQGIIEAIVAVNFNTLLLKKNDEGYFSDTSLIEFLEKTKFTGTYMTDYVYVLTYLNRKENDALEDYFKKENLTYRKGWEIFNKKEYLTKTEYKKELEESLKKFVERFEGKEDEMAADVFQMLEYSISYDKDGNEKSKKIKQTIKNFETILENDIRFKGKIKFNEFSNQAYNQANNRAWSSYDDSEVFAVLQSEYDLKNRNDYYDAVKNVSIKHKFHPVCDLLNSLDYDGKEHIKHLLPDYLGVENTEYSYQVMRMFMLGAVSRVYEPGCKFDYTLILTGLQGLGKSTFLRLLALKDEWFNDSLDSLDSDKATQSLMGSWIIELAELKSLARTVGGVDSVKRFLTATQDKLRLPYERRADIFLRQCVFAGTTNKSDFLQDETGNRRFLIVQAGINKPVKNVFSPEITEDIKAAWAEAVHIYKTENPKLILPISCQAEAERLQNDSMADDGKIGIITEYLSNKQRTCAIEIWQEALGEQGRPQKWQAGEINNIILLLPEWEKMKSPSRFGRYGQQRGFQKMSTNSNEKRLQSGKNVDEFIKLDEESQIELPFPE